MSGPFAQFVMPLNWSSHWQALKEMKNTISYALLNDQLVSMQPFVIGANRLWVYIVKNSFQMMAHLFDEYNNNETAFAINLPIHFIINENNVGYLLFLDQSNQLSAIDTGELFKINFTKTS